MKKAFRLIVTVLLLAGWGLAASALHVVWTGEAPVVIPKDHLGVRDTYVNVTAWTADDVAGHPLVVKRLVSTGHADVLAKAFTASGKEDLVAQINEALERGPTSKPAPSMIEKVAESVEGTVEQAKAGIKH